MMEPLEQEKRAGNGLMDIATVSQKTGRCYLKSPSGTGYEKR